jgi:hypothetical protein
MSQQQRPKLHEFQDIITIRPTAISKQSSEFIDGVDSSKRAQQKKDYIIKTRMTKNQRNSNGIVTEITKTDNKGLSGEWCVKDEESNTKEPIKIKQAVL